MESLWSVIRICMYLKRHSNWLLNPVGISAIKGPILTDEDVCETVFDNWERIAQYICGDYLSGPSPESREGFRNSRDLIRSFRDPLSCQLLRTCRTDGRRTP